MIGEPVSAAGRMHVPVVTLRPDEIIRVSAKSDNSM